MMKALFSGVFLFFLFAGNAHAASLYLTPSTGTYSVGDVFAVQVYVSSSDQAMNAAGGEITYPPSKLEVVSISTSGSIFSFWVNQPTFVNSKGLVGFEGVAFDPGYKGSAGKILTINFRAKQLGAAAVSFSSASVLANDGAATNILEQHRDAAYTIIEKESAPPPATAPPTTSTPTSGDTPGLPTIISTTHPHETVWYQNVNPVFRWELPKGVDAVRTSMDHSPSSIPSVEYSPPIATKEVKGLDSGVWYFHLQFRNEHGWGKTAHYKVKVDADDPAKPTIMERERQSSFTRTVSFGITSSDAHSGIDHYVIQVGDGGTIEWSPADGEDFVTDVADPNDYTLHVTALDVAGNSAKHSTHFVVLGLDKPEVVYVDDALTVGEYFRVQGTTAYNKGTVTLVLQADTGLELEYVTDIDEETGSFSMEISDLAEGDYVGHLYIQRSDGARSYRTDDFELTVGGASTLQAGDTLVVMSFTLLALLSILLLISLLLSYRKNQLLISRLHSEVADMETGVRRATHLLRNDIDEQLTQIRKARHSTELTEHEKQLLKTVQDDLRGLEQYLKRELDEIDGLGE